MSQRHLFRVLLAASALAGPGAAYAQCTKDTECKGDRVCERGACVSPAERTQPPPPPQPEYTPPPPANPQPTHPAPRPRPPVPSASESAWEASARKNVITYDLLSTAAGIAVAADLNARGLANGLTILQAAFAYERAIMPRFTVFGIITPSHWEEPGFVPTNYLGLTVGAKYYFFGEAPAGFYAGGQVGWQPLNLGAGIEPEVGYQLPLDFGLVLGAVLGVQVSVTPNTGQIYIRPALEGHIGWNF